MQDDKIHKSLISLLSINKNIFKKLCRKNVLHNHTLKYRFNKFNFYKNIE